MYKLLCYTQRNVPTRLQIVFVGAIIREQPKHLWMTACTVVMRSSRPAMMTKNVMYFTRPVVLIVTAEAS
jgi:hypothetical protein